MKRKYIFPIVSIILTTFSFYLAINQIDGYGYFLFIALLIFLESKR